MKDFVVIFAAVVAAIASLATAFFAWKLKIASDKNDRLYVKAKEEREELKLLYARVFVLFEQAIKQVTSSEKFALDKDISDVNAKVQLLSPQAIIDQYEAVGDLLHSWSALHAKASPRLIRVGEHTAMIVQAPDPTAKFKQPASEANEAFQVALRKLIEMMRWDLNARLKSLASMNGETT